MSVSLHKKILYAFLFILFGCAYYLILVDSSNVDATELYLWAFALFVFSFFQIERKWTIAYSFWLFVSIYTIGGACVYLMREYFYFNFPGDFHVPINIWLLATFVTIIFSLFDVGERKINQENLSLIKFNYPWMGVFVFSGSIAAFFMFRDGIPILAEDVNAARGRAVAESQGTFWFLYMGLQLVVVLLLIQLAVTKKSLVQRIANISLTMALIVILSLYGGRFFVFMPILFATAYLVYKKIIKAKYVFLVAMILVFIVIAVSMSRFYSRESDFGQLLILALRNDIFPEFRTLIQLESLINFFDVSYITNPFISFLPAAIYKVFGIDKNTELMLSIGHYLSSFDPDAENVGYRVSILGEIYLALGYLGVIFTMVLVSLSSIVAKNIVKNDLLYIYLIIMFSMLVPYGVTFIRSSIVMIPFGYLIMRLIIKSEAKSRKGSLFGNHRT